MKKKKYDTVVDEEWWENMSTHKGLPKDHPFLDRENRPEGYGGKETIVKEKESESKK